MKLEQAFEVKAPLERVWDALIDVERVAPCLPGAEVTGRNDDGSYDGTFKVKIGPTAAAYSGKLHMDEVDEGSHTATMHAQGTDRRGQGGAKATIVSAVTDAGDGTTRVSVVTDYHITGRLARFGRGGMIEEISNRLLNQFAKSLQQMLAGGGEAAAPAAGAGAAAAGAGAEPAPAGGAGTGAAAAEPAPAGGVGTGAAAAAAAAEPAPAGSVGTGAAAAAAAAEPAPAGAAPGEPAPAAEPAPADAAPGEPAPVAEPAPAAESAPAAAAEPAAASELAAVVPEADTASEPAPPAAEAPPAGAAAVEPPTPTPPPTSAAGAPSGTAEAAADASPFPGATPPPPQPPPASEPMQGLSLVGGAMWSQVKKNPAPAVALVLGFLLALGLLRKRG